jgi:hypothetical protein
MFVLISSLRGAKRRSNPVLFGPDAGLLRFARNDASLGLAAERQIYLRKYRLARRSASAAAASGVAASVATEAHICTST